MLKRVLFTCLVLLSGQSLIFCQKAQPVAPTAQGESFSCAFGVDPSSFSPFPDGNLYIAETDKSQTPYETYLYPNQSNEMPAAHRRKGEEIAATILPLDKDGNVDLKKGKILIVAEGMSNMRDEMEQFEKRYMSDNAELNPKVEFTSEAEGGCDLVCWIGKGTKGKNKQVQIVMMKHSNNRPQLPDGSPKRANAFFRTKEDKFFPNHAMVTKNMLKERLHNLKEIYPNLKQVYITSRSFGGYSCNKDYREPVGYEENFSVKWLIEDQVTGADPDLAFEGPDAPAPWIAWGPFLWDSNWDRSYFSDDGTHPSKKGSNAVADLWYESLSAQSTSRNWFMKDAATSVALKSFQATPAEQGVRLTWATTRETNHFGFEIQRRESGVSEESWRKLAFLPAETQNESGDVYEYFDASPLAGANEYRLIQHDANGETTNLGVLTANFDLPQTMALSQNYPNPFSKITEISFFTPNNGGAQLTIYNLLGQEVRRYEISKAVNGFQTVRWDGRDQKGLRAPNGVYVYRLVANGAVRTKSLLLME